MVGWRGCVGDWGEVGGVDGRVGGWVRCGEVWVGEVGEWVGEGEMGGWDVVVW